MKTEIRFLEELEEDLLGAASLEKELAGIDSSAPRARSPRKVVRGRRRTVRTMSLAAAAAVLMAAVVGYVATREAGNGTRQALPIPSPRQDQAANLRHDAAIIGRAVTDGTPYA